MLHLNTNAPCLSQAFNFLVNCSALSKQKIVEDFTTALEIFFTEYDISFYESFVYGDYIRTPKNIAFTMVFGSEFDRNQFGLSLCSNSTLPKRVNLQSVVSQLFVETLFSYYPIHDGLSSYTSRFVKQQLTPEQLASKFSYDMFYPEHA